MTAIERLLGYFDDFGPVSTTYENAGALIRRAIELDATTPEPETSPAKPAPNASQPGLRAGARVKIIHQPFSFTPHVGREALIKEEVVAGAWYQIALDGKGDKFMFRADELEVIE